ncbi:MAG TPA: dihydrolipoamide acetyltransferase family protein [Beutenbergiaceae bacterium]|nr:dihydrolipoamide acetyltransferase family protein [Beutenbergiaceae bacterium]
MRVTFALPDLGEGLTESDIVAWRVAEGDEVELNQILAEVETAKAVVELPSPHAGRIAALHAQAGQTVQVGAPLIEFEVEAADDDGPGAGGAAGDGAPHPDTALAQESGSGNDRAGRSEAGRARDNGIASPGHTPAEPAAATPASTTVATSASPAEPEPVEQRQSVLVGYGPKITGAARPKRRPRRFEVADYQRPEPVHADPGDGADAAAPATTPRAMPPVRALARQLGVDLRQVPGSGPDGLILRDDVHAALDGHAQPGTTAAPAREARQSPQQPSPQQHPAPPEPAGAEKQNGRARRIPVSGLRKHTAQAMSESAFTAPHASVQSTIDVTPTLDLLRRAREQDRGHAPSFLSLVCRAVMLAARSTPSVNSHFDAEAGQIEVFDHINLGIAVATDRGLVVASVDDAERLSAGELTERIAAQAARARDGSLTLPELTSSTLTVTNVGVFDVDSGVPILNPGESVIMAVGSIRRRPWEFEGTVALREVVTLTVSFDHRVLDGAEASTFLSDVTAVLSDPATALMR